MTERARSTTGDELRDHLTRLRFRPEVLPLASFQEGYIPHLDARNWARRLASNVYKQISKWVFVKLLLMYMSDYVVQHTSNATREVLKLEVST